MAFSTSSCVALNSLRTAGHFPARPSSLRLALWRVTEFANAESAGFPEMNAAELVDEVLFSCRRRSGTLRDQAAEDQTL